MKILQMTATNRIVHLDGVECRVWNGQTEAGVPCLVFVHRLAVEQGDGQAEFNASLIEKHRPTEVLPARG